MSDEYNVDYLSVVDDEGKEHKFEVIDAIETDDGRYVALLPFIDENEEIDEDEDGIVIFEVAEEDGEEVLIAIESDDVFDSVAAIFEERLNDLFDGEEFEEIDE